MKNANRAVKSILAGDDHFFRVKVLDHDWEVDFAILAAPFRCVPHPLFASRPGEKDEY